MKKAIRKVLLFVSLLCLEGVKETEPEKDFKEELETTLAWIKKLRDMA